MVSVDVKHHIYRLPSPVCYSLVPVRLRLICALLHLVQVSIVQRSPKTPLPMMTRRSSRPSPATLYPSRLMKNKAASSAVISLLIRRSRLKPMTPSCWMTTKPASSAVLSLTLSSPFPKSVNPPCLLTSKSSVYSSNQSVVIESVSEVS